MKKGIKPKPHRPRGFFFQAQMGQLLIYYCALCEITARNFAVHKKRFLLLFASSVDENDDADSFESNTQSGLVYSLKGLIFNAINCLLRPLCLF